MGACVRIHACTHICKFIYSELKNRTFFFCIEKDQSHNVESGKTLCIKELLKRPGNFS